MQSNNFFTTVLSLLFILLGVNTITATPLEKRGGNGDATFYTPGLGACGEYSKSNDMIAAVAIGRSKKECGRRVRVTRGSMSVDVVIKDLCEGCEWNDIDLTSAGFERIGELAEGRVQIHWEYI